MKKQRIKVWRRNADEPLEVDAYLVGGVEGVFAAYVSNPDKDRTLIHLVVGDDGHWVENTSYDTAWLPEIVEVLAAVNKKATRKRKGKLKL